MSVANNLYRFSMFCETEDKHVVTIISSPSMPAAPTGCPNSPTHNIVANSIKHVHTVYPDKIIVDESDRENVATFGNYYADCFSLDIGATGAMPVSKTRVYPYDISMFSVKFRSYNEHRGDRLEVLVSPDTIVGQPTANVSIGATTISVPSYMMRILYRGYHIKLLERSIYNDMGRIIELDWVNNQITVETPAAEPFTTAAAISMTIKYCDVVFGSPEEYKLGADMLGGSLIPKNTPVVINYYNLSSGNKSMQYTVEMKY